jgi:hypothetical protein
LFVGSVVADPGWIKIQDPEQTPRSATQHIMTGDKYSIGREGKPELSWNF